MHQDNRGFFVCRTVGLLRITLFLVLQFLGVRFLLAIETQPKQEYECRGRIVYRAFNGNGTPYVVIARNFELFVRGHAWLIITCGTNFPTPSIASKRWEFGSPDSKEIYKSVHTMPLNAATNTPISPESALRAKHGVAVIDQTGVLRPYGDGVAHFLWLMLASGRYLDLRGTNTLAVVFDPISSMVDFELRADWQRDPDAPFLPTSIVFYGDGLLRSLDAQKRVISSRFHKPYGDGFTNAMFYLLRSSNDAKLPIGFVGVIYRPAPWGISPNQLGTNEEVRAEITEWKSHCTRTDLTPALALRTTIQDRRLMSSNAALVFTSERGSWPTIDESKRASSKKPRNVSNWGLTVLLALVSMPLIVVALMRNLKK